MSTEGSISLDLSWDGSNISRVAIRSSRPLLASRLLEKKTPVVAQFLVPMLFSICGRAQAVAAACAVDAAQGRTVTPDVARQRELLVAAECVHEYLWRVVLDWPALEGEAADVPEFAVVRRRLYAAIVRASGHPRWWDSPWEDATADIWSDVATGVATFLSNGVFGVPPERWLEIRSLPDFEHWLDIAGTQPARLLRSVWQAPPVGRSATAFLPWLDDTALAQRLAPHIAADAHYARAPHWNGAPAETGALARSAQEVLVGAALALHGNSAAVRLLARLRELAQLTQRIQQLSRGEPCVAWARAVTVGAGAGCGAVDTARGMLVHHVDIERARIGRYRIVAPTEWNFHPRGAFAAGLQGHAAVSIAEVEWAARLLAHALDPCVAYEVSVSHA